MTNKTFIAMRRFIEKYRGQSRDKMFDKIMSTAVLIAMLDTIDAADHVFQSLHDKNLSTEKTLRELMQALDKLKEIRVG